MYVPDREGNHQSLNSMHWERVLQLSASALDRKTRMRFGVPP